jgi:hypothetical protein
MRLLRLLKLCTLMAVAAPAWSQSVQLLEPPPPITFSSFGDSVVLAQSGKILAVGTGCRGLSSCPNGRVFLYVKARDRWLLKQTLAPPRPTEAARFGYSVALSFDGSTVLVGVVGNGVNGSAFVYQRSADTWTMHGLLSSPNQQLTDDFGASLALSEDGNTALVGAPGWSCPHAAFCGAVFVFSRHQGSWSQTQLLTMVSPHDADVFGASLAFVKGVLLVGAPGVSCTAGDWCGALVAHKLIGGVWRASQTLLAPPDAGDGLFGIALALSGDAKVALVGAPDRLCESLPFTRCGAAYVLQSGSGGAWSVQTLLQPADPQTESQFGHSVALAAKGKAALVAEKCRTCVNHQSSNLKARLYSSKPRRRNWLFVSALSAIGPPNSGHAVAIDQGGKTGFIGVPSINTVFVYSHLLL